MDLDSIVKSIASFVPATIPIDGTVQAVALWYLLGFLEPDMENMNKVVLVSLNGSVHWLLHDAAARAQLCGSA